MHRGDVQSNATRIGQAFSLMRGAGARGVRTDVFWSDVEPAQGAWDADAMAGYLAYYRLAAAHGLQSLVILSGPPAWARVLFSNETTRPQFMAALEAYAYKVGKAVAGAMPAEYVPTQWQLWNEMNAIPSLGYAGDACAIFSAAGKGLRRAEAELRARRAQRSSQVQAQVSQQAQSPPWTFFANIMANVPFWESEVNKWVNASCAGGFIDALGVDHYPGTWALGAWTDWSPLQRVLARVSDPTPGNAWWGKLPAVLETGYSSWSSVIASEADQVKWVNESLPALRAIVANYTLHRDAAVRHNAASMQQQQQQRQGRQGQQEQAASIAPVPPVFQLYNYYELVDGASGGGAGGMPEESHFGVAYTWGYRGVDALAPKPALAALTAQIALFE